MLTTPGVLWRNLVFSYEKSLKSFISQGYSFLLFFYTTIVTHMNQTKGTGFTYSSTTAIVEFMKILSILLTQILLNKHILLQ